MASRSCDDRDRPIAHCFSENVGSFFGTGFEGRSDSSFGIEHVDDAHVVLAFDV